MQMNKNLKLLLFWLVLVVTAIGIYLYASAMGKDGGPGSQRAHHDTDR